MMLRQGGEQGVDLRKSVVEERGGKWTNRVLFRACLKCTFYQFLTESTLDASCLYYTYHWFVHFRDNLPVNAVTSGDRHG